jgi:hypothetical protein
VTPFENSEKAMDILGDTAGLVVLPDCGHVDLLVVPRNTQDLMTVLLDYLR